MMRDCWQDSYITRPSFMDIVNVLENILENDRVSAFQLPGCSMQIFLNVSTVFLAVNTDDNDGHHFKSSILCLRML